MPDLDAALNQLVHSAAKVPAIRAIGWSGGDRPFPQPGEGDIDLFLYCDPIPDAGQRHEVLASPAISAEDVEIGRFAGGHWGVGDCCTIAGVETWLLYFTLAEARAELADILAGKALGRVGTEYYPMGRCAMWKTLRALYDPDGFLQSLRDRLEEYPAGLANAVAAHHRAMLEDTENLERAVGRGDVFFYHFALDLALDHFLQALFALNRVYFPSRKRSAEHIRRFSVKPVHCEDRLRQVIAWGAQADTLAESYRLWQELTRELAALA